MEYDKKKLIPVNLIYWKSTNRPFTSYFLPLLKATPSVTLWRLTSSTFKCVCMESNYAINCFFLYITIQRRAKTTNGYW